jgi:hypothetical protein
MISESRGPAFFQLAEDIGISDQIDGVDLNRAEECSTVNNANEFETSESAEFETSESAEFESSESTEPRCGSICDTGT